MYIILSEKFPRFHNIRYNNQNSVTQEKQLIIKGAYNKKSYIKLLMDRQHPRSLCPQ